MGIDTIRHQQTRHRIGIAEAGESLERPGVVILGVRDVQFCEKAGGGSPRTVSVSTTSTASSQTTGTPLMKAGHIRDAAVAGDLIAAGARLDP
jgi:hypothetical protein